MSKDRTAGAVVWVVAFGITLSSGACSYAADALFHGAGRAADGGAAPKNCEDRVQSAGESDVDCGGGCGPCAVGKHCAQPAHCASQVCAGNDPSGAICQPPSFVDGVKNGSETGSDCGGSAAAPTCPPGQGCRAGSDCIDAVCKDAKCTTPGATDGVKNGTETDVDCGGAQAPGCSNGKGCGTGADCVSTACSQTLRVCAPVTAVDGVKNGTETDVDCGGPEAGVPRCAPGNACGGALDCASSVCTGPVCQPPTGTDGVKNGDESDADCGGRLTGAPRCTPGRICAQNADCSLGCNYQSRCVDSRTCTRSRGGDTCGAGETPSPNHESCCNLGQGYGVSGQTVALEKYLVTAGRMRAMVEALDGNFKGWITQNKPAWFADAWLASLPENKFDAEQGLGPYGLTVRSGCGYVDSGMTSARTYDTDSDILAGPPGAQVPDRAVEVPRDLLDEKPLNCVTFHMAAALCAYDDRQIASAAAINAAIAGPDGRTAPWGNAPTMADAPASLTAGRYSSYRNAGNSGTFTYRLPVDAFLENTRGIPAPGRMSSSAGAYGNYDLYAPFIHWTEAPGQFLFTYSWEGHPRDTVVTPYASEAYHAIGFRCMKVL